MNTGLGYLILLAALAADGPGAKPFALIASDAARNELRWAAIRLEARPRVADDPTASLARARFFPASVAAPVGSGVAPLPSQPPALDWFASARAPSPLETLPAPTLRPKRPPAGQK